MKQLSKLPHLTVRGFIPLSDHPVYLKISTNEHLVFPDGHTQVAGEIFGYYLITHQVDWDSALRNQSGNVNELRLFDPDRNIMPVGEAYKKLIPDWKYILNEESYGLTFDAW